MKLKERLTFANVSVSVLALFIALGGGAYAASRIPKNSVGTRQLKNNFVNSAKVADQSLTGSDIQSSSLVTCRRPNTPRGGIGELVDVVEAGERVVVILRPAGPGADGEPGLTANLTTFREGRAVEMIHYPNATDALAAIGLG